MGWTTNDPPAATSPSPRYAAARSGFRRMSGLRPMPGLRRARGAGGSSSCAPITLCRRHPLPTNGLRSGSKPLASMGRLILINWKLMVQAASRLTTYPATEGQTDSTATSTGHSAPQHTAEPRKHSQMFRMCHMQRDPTETDAHYRLTHLNLRRTRANHRPPSPISIPISPYGAIPHCA